MAAERSFINRCASRISERTLRDFEQTAPALAARGHPRLTKAGTGRHQPRHPFLFWTALVYDRAYFVDSR